MSLEIMQYVPAVYDPNGRATQYPKLGALQIKTSSHLSVWLEVIQSKNGGFFFRVPSIKSGEKWVPTYEFSEKKEFAKFCQEQLGDSFKTRYL